MNDHDTPMFARSPIGGKRTSDVKARVSDETKLALQRRCGELGMTESDFIDRLLCVSLFGLDKVLSAESEKTRNVVGLWHKVGPS